MTAFRWGLLGAGPVARKFALGLRALPDMTVAAVASRDPANAARLAAAVAPDATALESLEAMAGAAVDAVYVSLPPAARGAHVEACLAAGLPTLVEKPFAADAQGARALAAAARAAGTFCMEGLWTRFLPAAARLKAMADEGAFGRLRLVAGGFGIAERPDPARSLFDPARGGGAIGHRGVYPLSLACFLLGPPVEVRAEGTVGPTGVDDHAALLVRHAGGGVSTTWSSLVVSGGARLELHGEAGSAALEGPVYRPFRLTTRRVAPRDGEPRGGGRFEALKEGGVAHGLRQRLAALAGLATRGAPGVRYAGNGYGHEAEALRRCVRAGLTECPVMPLDESVAIVAAMDAARTQIRAAGGARRGES